MNARPAFVIAPFIAAACLVLSWSSPATAQPGFEYLELAGGGSRGVAGHEIHVEKRPATVLRVVVTLNARGKTLEEAIERMKEQRSTVATKVKFFGGDADTIYFGPISKSESADGEQQAHMMQMLRRQLRGRVPRGLQGPQSVMLNAPCWCDWKIEGETPEERLVFIEQLKEKLNGADLSGAQAAADEMTPEEREAALELEAMMEENFGHMNEGGELQNAPRYVFIARLTDEDLDAIYAAGYKKAHANAQRIARAAGGKLGKPISMRIQSDASSRQYSAISSLYQNNYHYGYRGNIETTPFPVDELEGYSMTPDEVAFRFVVLANYEMAPHDE